MNKPSTDPEFKVAEVREDGTAILEVGDGRMFPAQGIEGVKKNALVKIRSEGVDKEGVPKDAVVVSIK